MVSMPQGLISAPRLKPAIRLAQAVSEYEADLTRDQKETFNRYRSRACEKPPSIQDVMQLTADIDERLSNKIRGRCLGTRTTSFLQSVQQFVSLGDIIVGGTQNLVASGVWALVRTSLAVCTPRLLTEICILYHKRKEIAHITRSWYLTSRHILRRYPIFL